jgi:YVTN family beta-propeller protein
MRKLSLMIVGMLVLLAVSMFRLPRADSEPSVTASPAQTATQVRSISGISVFSEPRAIAVHTALNKIYVVNYMSNNVAVIDGEAHLVTAEVQVGMCPEEIAIDSSANKAYVLNSGTGSISVIDCVTDSSAGEVPLEGGAGHVALNPALKRLYVARTFGGEISVINLENMTEVATLQVGFTASSLAVNTINNKIYAGTYNRIAVIDGNTHEVITEIPIDYPNHIAVDSVADKIYATTTFGLAVLDGSTEEITIVLSTGRYSLQDVAVNPYTRRVYTIDAQALLVIDGQCNSLIASVRSNYGTGITINPSTERVYVAHPGTNRVSVVDVSRNILLGEIPIGENATHHLEASQPRVTAEVPLFVGTANLVAPNVITVNTQTGLVYVSCEQTNNLGVIHANTSQLVSATGLEDGPTDLAVDSYDNTIYVSYWYTSAISVIDGQTNVVTRRINLDDWGNQAIALDPTTQRLYVANGLHDALSVVDVANGTEITSISNLNPCDVTVNPVTKLVYVLNSVERAVSIIDGNTSELIESVEINRSLGGNPKIDVDIIRNRIYVSHAYGISVINGNTSEIVAEFPTYYFPAQDLAIHPVTGNLYVVTNKDLLVIDESSLEIISQYDLLSGGHACTVDPETGKVFVASFWENTVTVLGDSSCDLLDVIPLGSVPSAVEVNKNTDKVYVANRDTNTVMVINGSSNEIIRSVDVGVDPACVEVNVEKNHVYVAAKDCLYIIDGGIDDVIATVEYTGSPFDLALNPSTETIYVTTDLGDNLIWIIDAVNLTVVDVVNCPLVRSIAVNPETSKIYAEVAEGSGYAPQVISVQTIWTPWGLAGYWYTYGIGEVYSGLLLGGIRVFDGSNGTLSHLSTILYSPDVPRGSRLPLAVDPSLNNVYAAPNVVWRTDGKVLIIDGGNDSIVEGLYAPGVYSMDFKDIAVDRERSLVHVLLTDGYILTMEGATKSVVGLVDLDPRGLADRIAVNPVTGIIYTANSGAGTLSVIETVDCTPVAFFEHSPDFAHVDQNVTFDASLSYCPEGGQLVTYEWDFGDENMTRTSDPVTTHRFAMNKSYTVMLNVSNNQGLWSITSKTIMVNLDTTNPYISSVTQTPSVEEVAPGEAVNVTAIDVTDNVALDEVILTYSTDNVTFTNVTMTLILGTNNYTCQIPGQDAGTCVIYKIIVVDTSGNWIETEPQQSVGSYIVIAEFPSPLVVPFFIATTLLVAVILGRRRIP